MKMDGLDHPKTLDLASRLNVSRVAVIGHLELLWAFTGKQSPQGNIGKWPDGAIARACDWMGPATVFIEALVASGFLDHSDEHRLTVHDWSVHAQSWVRAKLKRDNLEFVAIDPNVYAETRDATRDATREPSSCAGVPSQAKPSVGKPRSKTPQSPPLGDGPVPTGGDTAPGADPPADAGTPSAAPSDVRRVFDFWRECHKHPQAQLDPKRQKLIRDALRRYDAEQLCQCIAGYKRSAYHMGQNEQRRVYDDIGLFLRDAAHIETGLNFNRQSDTANGGELIDQRTGLPVVWQ
jgi:hypothetical protein